MSTQTREYIQLADIKTLDDVPEYIFSRPFVYGPPEPINTPELCAAFLFHRHEDRTRHRIITIEPTCYGRYDRASRKRAVIEIHFSQDGMMISSVKSFPVTLEAVHALEDEHFLEPARMQGQYDPYRLALNAEGKQKVVQEWFREASSILDVLNAGGVVNLTEGRVTYPKSI